jgi:hypothetical protein
VNYDLVRKLPLVYREQIEGHFVNSPGTFVWKLQNFPKYVPRQALTRFLVKSEIFKQVLNIQGSVVECGVLAGEGLMTWAQLSAIFEHLNYQRKIIGFDTFAGFAELSPEDNTGESPVAYQGGLALDSYNDIMEAIRLYDMNRFLGEVPKVALVKGDIQETVPAYLEHHPETIISLLFLDVDVYAPTKTALEHFVPRMPRGAIIAFDELNDRGWPGETIALLDTIGVQDLRIQRFTYDTKISYAVLE